MRVTCESKTIYIDFLGCPHDIKESTERSNHDIHLEFRKYIAEGFYIIKETNENI